MLQLKSRWNLLLDQTQDALTLKGPRRHSLMKHTPEQFQSSFIKLYDVARSVVIASTKSQRELGSSIIRTCRRQLTGIEMLCRTERPGVHFVMSRCLYQKAKLHLMTQPCWLGNHITNACLISFCHGWVSPLPPAQTHKSTQTHTNIHSIAGWHLGVPGLASKAVYRGNNSPLKGFSVCRIIQFHLNSGETN